MMLKKLPQVYQQNKVMCEMAKLFEDKKIMFCSATYHEGGKCYVVKKTSGKPMFELDRPVYSMIRGMAKTLITSENNLKSQKDTFKTPYSKGDKEIEKMYQSLTENQKQNVFVMSTTLKKEEVESFINPDLYKLIGPQMLKKHQGKEISLRQVIQDLWQDKMTPILVECGPTIMNQYWKTGQGKKDTHQIQMVCFTCFEGKMKKECIGDQYQFDENQYKKVWESQKFQVKDENQTQGKLYFKVYEKKQ